VNVFLLLLTYFFYPTCKYICGIGHWFSLIVVEDPNYNSKCIVNNYSKSPKLLQVFTCINSYYSYLQMCSCIHFTTNSPARAFIGVYFPEIDFISNAYFVHEEICIMCCLCATSYLLSQFNLLKNTPVLLTSIHPG